GTRAREPAVEQLFRRAVEALTAGYGVLALGDRGVDSDHAPIPAALAISAVHHHLIRSGLRGRVSLVAETGEAREVSHIALLISYGASAVHPYLALETVASLARPELVVDKSSQPPAAPPATPSRSSSVAVNHEHYIKAVGKGLLKIMSKMGISTLHSYCGAQLWEA